MNPHGRALQVATPPGGAERPTMFDPKGPASHGILTVWWILFAIAVFVFVAVVALAVAAVVRGRQSDRSDEELLVSDARPLGASENRFIAVGGVLIPLAILIVVGVVTVYATAAIWTTPHDPVHIEVEAADWFWTVHEPGAINTANEIPVPVGRPVEIGLTSHDVIHSFWVPQLASKVDVIPGQRNIIHFTATKAGIYRGQCAEFCGLQHAHMIFFIDAMPAAQYRQWLDHHRRPPPAPTGGPAAVGRSEFEEQSCAGCHTVLGTSAHGTLGPDLTYFGSRRTLGAGTLDNTPANLARWITNSQAIKPGNNMPPTQLPTADIERLVAYLESQR